ncbi:unnamed protein product, partial [Hapterophycus canaliculatus]
RHRAFLIPATCPHPGTPESGDLVLLLDRRQGKKGDVLADRYEIIGDVGLGTFGRVVECWCMKRERYVAVKVVRKVAKYHESALIEAQILRDVNLQERSIRRGSSDASLCVEMFAQFEHQV